MKVREFYVQSMGIYGSPRIFCDLQEAGVACGENRVARLMRAAQIKSVRDCARAIKWAILHLLHRINCSVSSNTINLTTLG